MKGAKVEYNLNRFFEATCYYLGGLSIVLTALPTPYNGVALLLPLVIFIDFLISKWKKITTGSSLSAVAT